MEEVKLVRGYTARGVAGTMLVGEWCCPPLVSDGLVEAAELELNLGERNICCWKLELLAENRLLTSDVYATLLGCDKASFRALRTVARMSRRFVAIT